MHALLFLLLLLPAVRPVIRTPDAMVMVEVPAAEPEEAAEAGPEPGSADAPPGDAAISAAAMLPEPDIVIEQPEPPVMPPVASGGPDNAAGAAGTPGTGTGASGEGEGRGGGIVRARRLSGRIEPSDYPGQAIRGGKVGSVIVHFDVRTDGTVHRCRIRQSSGYPDMDATTCRLIEERFRYSPARDRRGQPVTDVAGWRQDWWLEPRP